MGGMVEMCVLRMYQAQLPLMGGKGSLFVDCFGTELEPPALELILELNAGKIAIVAQAGKDSYQYASFLELVEKYHQNLCILLESLACQPAVRLRGQLQFIWRGALNEAPSKLHAAKNEIIYEIVMTLWTAVLLRFRQAVSVIRSGGAGAPKDAAKLFMEAASLSQYVCVVLCCVAM